MPTDLPPPKPGHPLNKGGDRKPNPAAVFIAKVAEYCMTVGLFLMVTAAVAYGVMVSLAMMHASEPAVPPFGFFFLWGAINGSALLAAFAGTMVKNLMKDDE